ncbi:hypothetical protein [Rhizobium skierniewicense]|uniref:hypothetical protein n=1 Tax=Rhizobium skierniewicense TaxID=984260 RepID=UPI001574332B|nr:hypothetical protein [Rhizobium skierniewicense]
MPEQFNGSYAAAKSFVLTLTQSLAVELATKGVRIQFRFRTMLGCLSTVDN